LILLHVIEATYNSALEDLSETEMKNLDKFFGKGLKHLRVKRVVKHGGELKADLLVIGRKAEAGVLGRLEMTAYSIIRQSPCPVVSV